MRVLSPLKIPTGAAVGRVLTATQTDGTAVWADLPGLASAVGTTLYNSTAQTLAAGGTAISFDTEIQDPEDLHAAAAPTRITIKTAGWYAVKFSGYFTGTQAVGWRQVAIRKNGVTYVSSNYLMNSSQTFDLEGTVSDVLYLVPGDYLEVVSFHAATLTTNSTSVFAGRSPILSIVRIAAGGDTNPGPWTALPFTAGWAAYGAGHQTPQYRLVGTTVELRGLARATATWGYGAVVANFPVGLRPPATTFWSCPISDNVSAQAVARVDVWSTGELVIVQALAGTGQSGAVGSWVSLAPIQFSIV